MFTSWATPAGALTGLICGTLASFGHWLLYQPGILAYGSDMTASFYGAGVGWLACFLITVAVSQVTRNGMLGTPASQKAFHARRPQELAPLFAPLGRIHSAGTGYFELQSLHRGRQLFLSGPGSGTFSSPGRSLGRGSIDNQSRRACPEPSFYMCSLSD
jgi:hypothetical protein